VKTDLMPDFDFDAFNHDNPYEGEEGGVSPETKAAQTTVDIVSEPAPTIPEEDTTPVDNGSTEEVDKW
jgi:hypothetical protein